MPFIPPQSIRPIAVCFIRRGDSIFVSEGYDRVKDETFYRLIGGKIDFGELGVQAIRREFREELEVELASLRYLGAIENLFAFEGVHGHEIALLYEADFADDRLYLVEETTGFEDVGHPFRALWRPISDFGPGGLPLYPGGVYSLLVAGPGNARP